ncbi:MAG: amylosucrase [Bacteroidetes bacterium]|nr:amylosucrase [Bacteroidota bacterium]
MDQCALVTDRILEQLAGLNSRHKRWEEFKKRFLYKFPDLYQLLMELYGPQHDVHTFLESLIGDIWQAFTSRTAELVQHDIQLGKQSEWFLSHKAIGAVCYVDLFAGNFYGLIERIDYLKNLGVTYLHLMPIYESPHGASDGGYAVSDYRSFHEHLGSVDELRNLSKALRNADIALSLDFVLNHTSDMHAWARKAASGDPYYQKFYYIFSEYADVEAYSSTLRDIFPQVRKGSFSWKDELHAWVWTTFNDYQWDLNYGNHEVFRAIVNELLFLSNLGSDILRFDAAAFLWKEKGTRCESLPKVHTLIRALKLAASIAAPVLQFKSEAIVHPDEVLQYIDPEECSLSYNPLLMALSWEALATRNPVLLRKSIEKHMKIPDGCAWVNYVRCHDDIGWTFDDNDASEVGIDAFNHRKFLNQFYTNQFPGSFARGLPFQENSETGDSRISGTCASLAGLEEALEKGDPLLINHAIKRIRLLYGIAASAGGIPLLYLGDELGMLNDYTYAGGTERGKDFGSDSRWVHRPSFDWAAAGNVSNSKTPIASLYKEILHLFSIRKRESAFDMGPCRIVDHEHRHILGYARSGPDGDVLVFANFSDSSQEMKLENLYFGKTSQELIDILTGKLYQNDLCLQPWDLLWLKDVRGSTTFA